MAKGRTDILAARCSKRMKRRVRNAHRNGRISESDLVRSAVDEWFKNHPTLESKLDAVRTCKASESIPEDAE